MDRLEAALLSTLFFTFWSTYKYQSSTEHDNLLSYEYAPFLIDLLFVWTLCTTPEMAAKLALFENLRLFKSQWIASVSKSSRLYHIFYVSFSSKHLSCFSQTYPHMILLSACRWAASLLPGSEYVSTGVGGRNGTAHRMILPASSAEDESYQAASAG
jgi:hypothetical protein